MKYANITYPDVNNGVGCRVTLWVNGCTHHCVGCHNKHTWSFSVGEDFTEETQNELFKLIELPYIKGLTLSGGDPLDSFDDTLKLVKEFRKHFGDTKDIWLYSGYTLEEIANGDKKEILDYADVLVDGPFMIELKDLSLAFRGSSNQTIWVKNNGEWKKSNLND